MALTLATAMRDAIADQVDATINAGGAGSLVFATSGDSTVATLTLQNPAFGASNTGVITLQGTPLSDTNAAGGTMAKFFIKNNGGTTLITGTVSTSAADINFAGGVTVGAGDTVTLSSFTVTCPAS